MTESRAPRCFVLMPFEDDYEAVWLQLIKEPLELLGYTVRRADSLLNQQSILRDIVQGIVEADLIIADVTGLNSNVLYELGLAHALGKRTMMITRTLSELPFDLRTYRANEYSVQFSQAGELRTLVEDVGRAVLANEAEFSNPVQDFAPHALPVAAQITTGPSNLSRTSSLQQDESSDQADEPDSDIELGYLERTERLSTLGSRVTERSLTIGRLTEEIGDEFERATERLAIASQNAGGNNTAAMLAISQDVADKLNQFCEDVEPERDALRLDLAEFTSHADAVSREVQINSDADAAEVESTITALAEFEGSLDGASAGTGTFATSLLTMPNAARNLTRACKRGGNLLSSIGETLTTSRAEVARAREFLAARLDAYRSSHSDELE